MEFTHPNFKSIIPHIIKDASDINKLIGHALQYQYLFEKKIPSSEINNWQRGGKGLHSFKIKIQEIDRVFFIKRFLVLEWEGKHYGYTFIGRVDDEKTFYYVYLEGTIHPKKMNARGYIFISENIRVFTSYLKKDHQLKMCINQFLLKSDNIVASFTEKEMDKYSSLFKKEENNPLTLFDMCLEKMKNNRKKYGQLPSYFQNFLDYKNVQDILIERQGKLFEYYLDYGNKKLEDWFIPPRHLVEFCLICSDPKTQNHLLNCSCYILECSHHIIINGQVDCPCSLCNSNLKLLYTYEDEYEDDTRYRIPLTIHQPNMERLCIDMLETNYCENILKFQYLFKKRTISSEKGNFEFKIHIRDVDQLYYVWNDKNFYYPHHYPFNILQRGYFIRVMGRLKKPFLLYFEMVMWTLFEKGKNNDNDHCYRDGFIFFSKDPSFFIYCIIKQYSEKHQKEILKKMLDKEKISIHYDRSKIEEMEKIYYFTKYNCVKEYLKNHADPVDYITHNYLRNLITIDKYFIKGSSKEGFIMTRDGLPPEKKKKLT